MFVSDPASTPLRSASDTPAFSFRSTPFQLDGFTAEWDELSRARDAHLHEVDQLRTANRNLSSQVKQLESSLTLLNTEQCVHVSRLLHDRAICSLFTDSA